MSGASRAWRLRWPARCLLRRPWLCRCAMRTFTLVVRLMCLVVPAGMKTSVRRTFRLPARRSAARALRDGPIWSLSVPAVEIVSVLEGP